VFSLSALVILDLSCRLEIFLKGKRILSIVIVFSWKSHFTRRLTADVAEWLDRRLK
jgi:hypothetical protein